METKSTNKQLKKIAKYIRELSVVVIGIALTFTVSNWISSKNEKNELNRHLNVVKIELENNLQLVKKELAFYKKTSDFSKYLLSAKREDLNRDTLDKYNIIGDIQNTTFKTSAFEMLKSSGGMKLIKDEQLLSNISESYTMLEEARKGMESYMARKMDELYNTVLDNQILLDKHDILDPRYNRLYYFFSAHINLDEVLVSCERQVTKTLELFK